MANSNDGKILELAGKVEKLPWTIEHGESDCVSCEKQGVRTTSVKDGGGATVAYDGHDGYPFRGDELTYSVAAANCAPDLVRRIAALRDVLEEVYQQRAGKEAIDAALRADATACAAMKVGDE